MSKEPAICPEARLAKPNLRADDGPNGGLHGGDELGSGDHAVDAEHVLREQVERRADLPEGRDVLRLQHALGVSAPRRSHLVGPVLQHARLHRRQIALHQALREHQQRRLQRLSLSPAARCHLLPAEDVVVCHGHVQQQLDELLRLTRSAKRPPSPACP